MFTFYESSRRLCEKSIQSVETFPYRALRGGTFLEELVFINLIRGMDARDDYGFDAAAHAAGAGNV